MSCDPAFIQVTPFLGVAAMKPLLAVFFAIRRVSPFMRA